MYTAFMMVEIGTAAAAVRAFLLVLHADVRMFEV